VLFLCAGHRSTLRLCNRANNENLCDFCGDGSLGVENVRIRRPHAHSGHVGYVEAAVVTIGS
jgi:hypothetical protein